MSERDDFRFPFDHPKNITVGMGRILYSNGGDGLSPGWVLPGGERTQAEFRAREAALWIDSVTPRKAEPVGHGDLKSEAAALSAAQL